MMNVKIINDRSNSDVDVGESENGDDDCDNYDNDITVGDRIWHILVLGTPYTL